MDCSPPSSSVQGILQVRILEWVSTPFSRGSLQPRDRTQVSYISCTGRWVLYHCTIWEAQNLYGQLKFILIGVIVCFRNVKCISRNLNVFRLNTLVILIACGVQSYWLFFFNWRIMALQCCVSFCYTTMWISYLKIWNKFACHPYAGAMLTFSVSFQFQCMCCQSKHKTLSS